MTEQEQAVIDAAKEVVMHWRKYRVDVTGCCYRLCECVNVLDPPRPSDLAQAIAAHAAQRYTNAPCPKSWSESLAAELDARGIGEIEEDYVTMVRSEHRLNKFLAAERLAKLRGTP